MSQLPSAVIPHDSDRAHNERKDSFDYGPPPPRSPGRSAQEINGAATAQLLANIDACSMKETNT